MRKRILKETFSRWIFEGRQRDKLLFTFHEWIHDGQQIYFCLFFENSHPLLRIRLNFTALRLSSHSHHILSAVMLDAFEPRMARNKPDRKSRPWSRSTSFRRSLTGSLSSCDTSNGIPTIISPWTQEYVTSFLFFLFFVRSTEKTTNCFTRFDTFVKNG